MSDISSTSGPNDLLLLMFAYHFPPENVIGGLRPFRFSKYLLRQGVRSHTITAADVKTRPDLDAETVANPFVTRPREGIGWQIERLIRKVLLPGSNGSQWAWAAYKAACQYLDSRPSHERTIVLSTYPPLGTPLAGYWLARKRKLPWILDFRDPMADNMYDLNLNRFQRAVSRHLERRFVTAADCVIANTDAAQTRLRRTYPHMAEKISLLWNGFDPEQRLVPVPVPVRSQRIYSHVGELYEGRVITPLLYSIQRLIQGGKITASSILIQLIGPVKSSSVPPQKFLDEATQQGWLKMVAEQRPQSEAQRIMQESDGLLLVQPMSTLQVPGKLYEYVQIGRPILAYILPETPIQRILERSKVPCAFAFANAGDQSMDEALLRFFQTKTQAASPSEWFENGFNAQRHAEQLLQLMHHVQAAASETPAQLPV